MRIILPLLQYYCTIFNTPTIIQIIFTMLHLKKIKYNKFNKWKQITYKKYSGIFYGHLQCLHYDSIYLIGFHECKLLI